MADNTLDQWVAAAFTGDPADPIEYARTFAEAALRNGRLDEARAWKAVIEQLQVEFAKPLPAPTSEPGSNDDSSPVF